MIHAMLSRSKVFVEEPAAGSRSVTISAENGPVQLPDWVSTTATFKQGVRDGSIKQIVMVEPEEQAQRRPLPAPPYGLGGPDPNALQPPEAEESEETIEVVTPATIARRSRRAK
jgi:hypothetical protein